jgi:hydrogenase nickel incorporation protein HypA/HybF
MHEISLAKEIVRLVEEELGKRGKPRLFTVKLRIGKLTAVDPSALSFSFERVIEGSNLAGARLVIEETPLRGRCRDCFYEFEIEEMIFLCPNCSSKDVDIISGQEFDLVSIEVEGEDESKSAG